jgi:hypothetical protein
LALVVVVAAGTLAAVPGTGPAPAPGPMPPLIDQFSIQEEPGNCYVASGHVKNPGTGCQVHIWGVMGDLWVDVNADGSFSYGMQASQALDGYVYAQAKTTAGQVSNVDQDYIIP